MAFTTWTALRTTVRDSLADGSWKYRSYDALGRAVRFSSLKEVMEFLDYVDKKIAEVTLAGGSRNFVSFREDLP